MSALSYLRKADIMPDTKKAKSMTQHVGCAEVLHLPGPSSWKVNALQRPLV